MANGDLPFFKFYPKEFLSSGKVSAMSAEAVGVYIRFLCMAWNETPPCTIPDDDRILAAWSTLGETGWQRVSCAVRACFTSAPEGRLLNARLLAEYNEARYQQKKKQNAGKAGADKRWQTHGSAMGVPCDRDSKQRVSEVRSQTKPPPPLAGGREAAGPTAIDRIQAMIGRDLSSSDRLTITRAEDKYGHMGTVEIHGQQVGYIDLFDRAVGVAIAEPGFQWRTAMAFTKYIAAIVQRSVDERVWPGERAEPVGVGVGTPAMPPVSKAEQEAVERAWAKQQAKEARR